MKPGDRILLDDGSLELEVVRIAGTEIVCTVIVGGALKDHKGMNLPGVNVSAPSLTTKDREDAKFALKLGVDYLALSFVRSADDVRELRKLIESTGARGSIIAKIELSEALDNIEGISTSRTASWSPVGTWVSSSRRNPSHWFRASSSTLPVPKPNRSSSPHRCWSRWCTSRVPPEPKSPMYRSR